MRLSELEIELKTRLSKWKIELDNELVTFSVISWSEETKLDSFDLDYIEYAFGSYTLISKIRQFEENNLGIDHIIQIKHNIKFEKEEWEE
jgi:hypothetical protein